MFEELWLIKNSLCYYYKSWTDTPIEVDNDLFSGFFSAFNSFQEEVFPNQFVNYIDFIDSRLLFLKFGDLFIIVRDVMQKPLTRSLLQLNNLSIEIISQIELVDDLKSTLLSEEGSTTLTSTELITSLLNPIVDDTINLLSSSGNQMNKFDLMAVILILRELNSCISKIVDSNLFTNFQCSSQIKWFYSLTINIEPLDPTKFSVISYNLLVSFVQSYFDYLAKNLSKYKLQLNNDQLLDFYNELNKFLAVNREALSKFRLTDLYISKFLGNIYY